MNKKVIFDVQNDGKEWVKEYTFDKRFPEELVLEYFNQKEKEDNNNKNDFVGNFKFEESDDKIEYFFNIELITTLYKIHPLCRHCYELEENFCFKCYDGFLNGKIKKCLIRCDYLEREKIVLESKLRSINKELDSI